MPRFTFTEDRGGQRRERVVNVVLRKRQYGGYNVVRKDTGHELGWVVQVVEEDGRKLWNGYAGRDPFLPQGMDILAKLKADVSSTGTGELPGSGLTYRPVVRDAERGWAVDKLVQHLSTNWAVALDPIDVKATQAELDQVQGDLAEAREVPGMDAWVERLTGKAAHWAGELALAEAAHPYVGYWDTNAGRELCRTCGEPGAHLLHRQPAA